MLKITIELIPYGIESMKKTIGTMIIHNISRKGLETNTYAFEIEEERLTNKIRGTFPGYVKTENKPSWHLILAILNHIFKKEA